MMFGLRRIPGQVNFIAKLSKKVVVGTSTKVIACHQQCPKSLCCTASNFQSYRAFSTEPNSGADELKSEESSKQCLGKIEGKLMIEFTCKKCNARNSKTMTKLAYEKGVVIIRCDGCKNNHLIADNLGWFGNDPRKRNIEKLMLLNKETVKRLNPYGSAVMEAVKREETMIETKIEL